MFFYEEKKQTRKIEAVVIVNFSIYLHVSHSVIQLSEDNYIASLYPLRMWFFFWATPFKNLVLFLNCIWLVRVRRLSCCAAPTATTPWPSPGARRAAGSTSSPAEPQSPSSGTSSENAREYFSINSPFSEKIHFFLHNFAIGIWGFHFYISYDFCWLLHKSINVTEGRLLSL